MMQAGHLSNGFIMTMTSLTYSQQSIAHYCIELISLFFYSALFFMPLFLDINQPWECLADVTSCKISEDEQKRFEVRHVHCAWAGTVRPLSSHSGSDCCMMATLNSMGQQAVMVDRVALMWWTWYSYPYHWEPPPHHVHTQTDPWWISKGKN